MKATLERLRELRRKRNTVLHPSTAKDDVRVHAPVYHTANNLPDYWRCEFEERAAIREYDGGQVREHAEAEAFHEILNRMRVAGELV